MLILNDNINNFALTIKNQTIRGMNNIIIIGNGFDLAHGMKTSYTDFIKHMVNEHIEDKSRYSDLFDLPSSMILLNKGTSSTYSFKINSYDALKDSINKRWDKNKIFNNRFVESLIKQMALENWCDIESFYFQELLNIKDNNSSYYTPKELNDDFEILKHHLSNYLLTQENDSKEMEEYASFFQKIDSKNTIIVNFNYTRTIHTHYAKYLQNSKIIDIHGQLDDTANPMIFGYAAINSEIEELLKGDNHYFRNIKKVMYKKSSEETHLLKALKHFEDKKRFMEEDSVIISILGHSCGISDSHILNKILSLEKIVDIYIYYFKDYYSGFYDTHINLRRIVNNDVWEKVVDFPNSTCMPQHDDIANDELSKLADKVYEKQMDRSNVYSPSNMIS